MPFKKEERKKGEESKEGKAEGRKEKRKMYLYGYNFEIYNNSLTMSSPITQLRISKFLFGTSLKMHFLFVCGIDVIKNVL